MLRSFLTSAVWVLVAASGPGTNESLVDWLLAKDYEATDESLVEYEAATSGVNGLVAIVEEAKESGARVNVCQPEFCSVCHACCKNYIRGDDACDDCVLQECTAPVARYQPALVVNPERKRRFLLATYATTAISTASTAALVTTPPLTTAAAAPLVTAPPLTTAAATTTTLAKSRSRWSAVAAVPGATSMFVFTVLFISIIFLLYLWIRADDFFPEECQTMVQCVQTMITVFVVYVNLGLLTLWLLGWLAPIAKMALVLMFCFTIIFLPFVLPLLFFAKVSWDSTVFLKKVLMNVQRVIIHGAEDAVEVAEGWFDDALDAVGLSEDSDDPAVIAKAKANPQVGDTVRVLYSSKGHKGKEGKITKIDEGNMFGKADLPYQIGSLDGWYKEDQVQLITKADGSEVEPLLADEKGDTKSAKKAGGK